MRAPALRRLAERGVVASGMEAVFPSTTWPTHVSLVTGVLPAAHGVVGNSILDRSTGRREDLTGDPVHDAAAIVRVPTLYDRAHAAGLATAAVDWPATRHAASLDWNLPFFKDQRVFEAHTAPEVWRELGALGYPLDRQGEWAQLPKRFFKDAMVADVALHVLARRRPDVLLIHFLCIDSFQHLAGPRSAEAYWAIEYVDALVGRLAAAVDELTTLVVVSDHGFLPVERDVRPNVRLRRLGLLSAGADGQVTDAEARFVMNHGAGYVYARRPAIVDVAALRRELAAIEGVAAVWTEAEYPTLGLPRLDDNRLVGDLLVEAIPGYCFADDAGGEQEVVAPRYRGTHGHRAAHADNHAFFLAVGPGIRRGVEIGAITSRDVAPTLAHLLGLPPAGGDGRLLAEILDA